MPVSQITGDREIKLYASPYELSDFLRRVKLGEVLRGQIRDVLGQGKVVVGFKGFNLVAETGELDFSRGAVFYAQVKALSPKVVVKLVKPGEEMAEDVIRPLLRSFGGLVTKTKIEIARALTKSGLPVTKELVDEIAKNLAKLPPDKRNIPALVFLKAQGIPLSSRHVAAAKFHLFDQAGLSQRLSRLLNLVNQRDSPGLDPLLKDEIAATINRLFIKPGQADLIDQLRGYLARLGADYEYQIVRYHKKVRKSLKGQLLRLRSELVKSPDLASLLALTEEILGQIQAIQLINDGERRKSFYLPIPLQFPQGVEEAELKISRNPNRQRPIDPDDFHLALLLNTSNLGPVQMKARLKRKVFTGHFWLSDQRANRFVSAHIGELGERLDALGYFVGGITCSVKKAGSGERFRVEEPTEDYALKGIDVKV
ncbi:MAG: flagellar hook-length control protein FliK [bacterium]